RLGQVLPAGAVLVGVFVVRKGERKPYAVAIRLHGIERVDAQLAFGFGALWQRMRGEDPGVATGDDGQRRRLVERLLVVAPCQVERPAGHDVREEVTFAED